MMRPDSDLQDSIAGVSRREFAMSVYSAYLQHDRAQGVVAISASGRVSPISSRQGVGADKLSIARHELEFFVDDLTAGRQNPAGLPSDSDIPTLQSILQRTLPQTVRDRLGWSMNEAADDVAAAALYPLLLTSRNPASVEGPGASTLEKMSKASQAQAARFDELLFEKLAELQQTDDADTLRVVGKMLKSLGQMDLQRYSTDKLAAIAEALADFPPLAGAYTQSPAFTIGYETERTALATERTTAPVVAPAPERSKIRDIGSARRARGRSIGDSFSL